MTRNVSGMKNSLTTEKLTGTLGILVSRGPMLFSDVVDIDYDYFG